MTEKPKFSAQMSKSGRWFVAVVTGHGPDSHVGDFATEEEAQHWVSTRSKDWPHPAGPRAIKDGLYSFHIHMLDGAHGRDSGVLILRDGRFLGGGPYFWSTGSYTCRDGT
jgi:hypothetical protein